MSEDHGADRVAAWLLYLVQLFVEIFLFVLLVASVMAGDSCETAAFAPRACSGLYFAAVVYGFALILVIAALTVPVLIVRAGRRGGRRWRRPVVAIVLLIGFTIAYLGLLTL